MTPNHLRDNMWKHLGLITMDGKLQIKFKTVHVQPFDRSHKTHVVCMRKFARLASSVTPGGEGPHIQNRNTTKVINIKLSV